MATLSLSLKSFAETLQTESSWPTVFMHTLIWFLICSYFKRVGHFSCAGLQQVVPTQDIAGDNLSVDSIDTLAKLRKTCRVSQSGQFY